RSMTGFARSQASGDWGTLTWEVRSVNHRYLDVQVRIPEAIRAIEPTAKQHVSTKLSRGKVELNARLDLSTPGQQIELDYAHLNAISKALQAIGGVVTNASAPATLQLLQYPGVQRELAPDMDAVQASALDALN